jgi:hypothetical protein
MRRLADLGPNERAIMFDRLRRQYPSRRDFHAWQIRGLDNNAASTLKKLGFSCI